MKKFGQIIVFIIIAYLFAILIDLVVEKFRRWNAKRIAMKTITQLYDDPDFWNDIDENIKMTKAIWKEIEEQDEN